MCASQIFTGKYNPRYCRISEIYYIPNFSILSLKNRFYIVFNLLLQNITNCFIVEITTLKIHFMFHHSIDLESIHSSLSNHYNRGFKRNLRFYKFECRNLYGFIRIAEYGADSSRLNLSQKHYSPQGVAVNSSSSFSHS